jgi:hypothetical protein
MSDLDTAQAAQLEFLANQYWNGNWKRDNPNLHAAVTAYIQGGTRPTDTPNHYGQAMILLEDLVRALEPVTEPPPTGTLPYRPPPGWNGNEPEDYHSFPSYEVREVKRDGTVSMTNGKDYVLLVDADYSGGGRIWVTGGRHIVAIAGEVDYTNSSGDGFNSSFQFEGGDDGAIVHVEGFRIKNQPNGFTLKAPKMFQFQNIHTDLRDSSGQGHPDLIQVWSGAKAKGIRIHGWTGYSGFTYFSDFTDDKGPAQFGSETPGFWDLRNVDIHHVNGQGLGCWLGSPNHAVWRGGNCWWETSTEPTGNRRDLGDQARQNGLQYPPSSPAGYAQRYEIFDTDGKTSLYKSPPNPQGGAPGDIGRLQGQYLRYLDNPRMTLEWRCQKAPVSAGADANGNFVPAASVGVGYKSPGYV